ncbi:MAG: right-handed parallel beta-helix repeat-containing protein, partial [Kiritimatiellae bacterium]|nr:right-handed parallel beta-helix repeat-containing protein [Kiritimatiellia bacterium]
DEAGDGSDGAPYRTLTRALADAQTRAAGEAVEIRVAAGEYGEGETFPLSVPTGTKIVSVGGRSRVNGGDAAANVVVFDGSATSSVTDFEILGSTEAAVSVKGASTRIFLDRCRLTQVSRRDKKDGALAIAGGSNVRLDDCEMSCISGRTWVVRFMGDGSKLTMNRCLVDRNEMTTSGGNGDHEYKCSTIYGKSGTLTMNDCTFSRNTVPNKVPHDSACSTIAYLENFTLSADRCRFVGNRGASLLGLNGSSNYNISNTLVADNVAQQAMAMGYNAKAYWHNCTLVRNSGGYSTYQLTTVFYHSIIYGNEALSKTSSYQTRSANRDNLHLRNTLVRESAAGEGWNSGSTVLDDIDPQFECVDVPWDDPSFDVHLRPQSVALDRATTFADQVLGEQDLDGRSRILDNTDSGLAVADLGCYESAFHASDVPAFQFDRPGALYGFCGGKVSARLTISPAASGATHAVIRYGEGLSGPATLDFAEGQDAATLEITLAADCPSVTRVWVSDGAGKVLAADADVYAGALDFTIGGRTQVYVPVGGRLEFRPALRSVGVTAPEEIAVSVGSARGTGSNGMAWEGGNVIAQGETKTEGCLVLVGGEGRNEIDLTLSAGTFVESRSSSVTIEVCAQPGYVVLDPKDGVDAFGRGTADAPFKTLDYAKGATVGGDEIRLLPGVYNYDHFTLPIDLGERTLRGWNPSGATDRAQVVIDGLNECRNLFAFEHVASAGLANLTLKDVMGNAVLLVSGSSVSVSNCVLSQSHDDIWAEGAVHLRNLSSVTLEDCDLSGIKRRGVIHVVGADDTSSVTAKRCTFRSNTSLYGTLCGDFDKDGGSTISKPRFYLTDCVFEGNGIYNGNQIGDVYRCSCVAIRRGGVLEMNRCRVLGGTGGHVIGISDHSTARIANTLFAGNAADQGLFSGYSSTLQAMNCTFVGNRGGYAGTELQTTVCNSIILSEGPITFVNGFNKSSPKDRLWLYRTIVWQSDKGDGWHGASTVIEENPMLKKADVAWDDPAFNVMPTDGPAIDAGNNDDTVARWADFGSLDVNGGPRFQAGYARNRQNPIIDLGCCESALCRKGLMIFIR